MPVVGQRRCVMHSQGNRLNNGKGDPWDRRQLRSHCVRIAPSSLDCLQMIKINDATGTQLPDGCSTQQSLSNQLPETPEACDSEAAIHKFPGFGALTTKWNGLIYPHENKRTTSAQSHPVRRRGQQVSEAFAWCLWRRVCQSGRCMCLPAPDRRDWYKSRFFLRRNLQGCRVLLRLKRRAGRCWIVCSSDHGDTESRDSAGPSSSTTQGGLAGGDMPPLVESGPGLRQSQRNTSRKRGKHIFPRAVLVVQGWLLVGCKTAVWYAARLGCGGESLSPM